MDFVQNIVAPAWEIIPILDDKTLTNDVKLEQLTNVISKPIEAIDDLGAEFAPLGLRPLVRLIVDNPISDNLQRNFLARPIAEVIFQAWTVGNRALDGLSEFAQRIAIPGRELIAELARTGLHGTAKHSSLKAKTFDVLKGVVSLTDFLPAGLREFLGALRSSELVTNALDLLAGVIAEVLYRVYVFLHPEIALPALA